MQSQMDCLFLNVQWIEFLLYNVFLMEKEIQKHTILLECLLLGESNDFFIIKYLEFFC